MMLKRVLKLALAVTLGLPVGQAKARALRCESVFTPTPKEVLEIVNKETSGYLFNGKTIDEVQASLSWGKKRTVRKLLRNTHLDRIPSEKAMERHAVELGMALFGRKDSLSRWITKNGEQRLEESTHLIIKEQLLKEGLVKTWGDHYDPANISRISKITDKLWRFQHSRIMQFAGIPYWLPKMKDSAISTELMYKVIRDGYNKHEKEIALALKSQNSRDAYNTFKRVYSPVIFSILFVFMLDEGYDQYQNMITEQVDTLVASLQQQREEIEKATPFMKLEEGKAAYQKALEVFNEQWGESPTADEDALIQAKIEEALGLQAGSLRHSE
ncbi:hypothetical protein [Bdellovibrio sp. HCB209]|uniref:hypothetical protein n=1 Tax=Bdellovibrio sp. HCB209 TaxID=3394354 RepID=UPI0039B5B5E8